MSEINEEILGFKLYSNKEHKYLKANDTLLYDDIINFKMVNSLGVKLGKYSIEYIPLISEINYEELNTNFDSVEYYSNDNDDFSSFYQPETFKLKKSNILFSVNHCYKTCEKCSYHGDENKHKCELCSSNFSYYVIEDILNNFINCFQKCPENYTSDESNNFLCIKRKEEEIIDSNSQNINSSDKNCSESFPYEITENQTCVNECHAKDFFNKICRISYQSIKAKERILENIRKEITNHSMDSLLINVTNENKLDLFIKEEDELYQITSSYNQNNKEYNISTIKLGLCEDILKYQYNITQNNTLIILKIEYYIEGLYIPIIEYEVYHPKTKEK